MDKIKNINDWGNVSILIMKKVAEYARPKFRLAVLPTITTVLMKVITMHLFYTMIVICR